MKKLICLIMLLLIVLASSSCSTTNNRDNISKSLTDEVERTLSVQLSYNLHNYPENKNIPIRIVSYDKDDKLYFVLVDDPANTAIEDKEVYIFTLNYGMLYLYKQSQYKYIDNYNNQDIKMKLASDYSTGQILLSKEKGEQKRELSHEIMEQNEIAINKVFDAIKSYFNSNPNLLVKYGNNLLLELTVDNDDLIVNSDFTGLKISSNKSKEELFGRIYLRDDSKSPLKEFQFEKKSPDDSWTKKIRSTSEIKTYKLNLN